MKKTSSPTYIPGTTPPRSWRNQTVSDVLVLLTVLCLFAWLVYQSASVSQRAWQWERIFSFLFYKDKSGDWQIGMLIKGFFTTIRLGIWSMLFAVCFGGIIGIFTANRRGITVLPFTFFVHVLRNIPPLIFLFLIYFFSGSLLSNVFMGLENFVYTLPSFLQVLFSNLFAPPAQIERMAAAVLALGIYEGVYIAEIIRSSIESISKTQREAAYSLGFNSFQSLYYIILPQAKRIMLPPLAGQTISTFKDSALAALVSLPELTFQSLEIMAVTRMTFEVWILCMLLYLAISKTCTTIFTYLERKQKWRFL